LLDRRAQRAEALAEALAAEREAALQPATAVPRPRRRPHVELERREHVLAERALGLLQHLEEAHEHGEPRLERDLLVDARLLLLEFERAAQLVAHQLDPLGYRQREQVLHQ